VSHNPFLIGAVDSNPSALSITELRQRVWQLLLPLYLERLNELIESFGAARTKDLGSDNLVEIATAVATSRISNLLIEADRVIPGRFDPVSGALEITPLEETGVDDLLDDLGEHALKRGAEVVIVPAERMPTDSGMAAIYRF
jgi:hypothetical protein